MGLDKSTVVSLIGDDLFPALKHERENLDRIDKWYHHDHDTPWQPRSANREYKELSGRAQTPWLGLVVTSVAQSMYVEGYRSPAAASNAAAWESWQRNGMDRRQIAVHRATLAYGLAYGTCLPGTDFTGAPMPVMRGVSPRRMIAMYEDPAGDDFPTYALQAEPAKVNGSPGWTLKLFDDESVHYLHCGPEGDSIMWIENREHDLGICPVVRFANMLDLEGRSNGEVEPFIPIAGRIDQTVFDRLVVQRFASWIVRTIAGMTKPEGTDAEVAAATEAAKLRLRAEDILIADDPDTKFGSLPASDLGGFILAKDADVRDLAAVSQTPPHHLLGQMANLSAEALAAAESSLGRKVEERKHSFGESHEQWLRLSSLVAGDIAGAQDVSAQVRWRDMESRSLAQTADALGKLATMLGVPVQMLWERIPGWTQDDVEEAKNLTEQNDNWGKLLDELAAGHTTAPAAA